MRTKIIQSLLPFTSILFAIVSAFAFSALNANKTTFYSGHKKIGTFTVCTEGACKRVDLYTANVNRAECEALMQKVARFNSSQKAELSGRLKDNMHLIGVGIAINELSSVKQY